MDNFNRETTVYLIVLFTAGALWGLSMPLMQIAVSEGYRHLGLIFWQMVIMALLFGLVQIVRGKSVPLSRPALWVYLVIALLGSLLPATALYEAARHLPAGLLSILIAFVPLITFPMAILARTDEFDWKRFGGLVFGLFGVAMIVLPESSLPDPAKAIFVLLALIGSFFYACEANYVAKWGTAGLDPVEVILGSSVIGIVIVGPAAMWSGDFIDPRTTWNAPEYALVILSLVSGIAYAGYVWLISKAGAVFAAQAGYLITGFGVLWSIVLLSETYSIWVWGALVVVMAGVFLVQPRQEHTLAQTEESDQTPFL